MKKFLALALAVVMLLCFAGCAKDRVAPVAVSDAEKIVGSWTCEVDLTEYMNANMGDIGLEGFEMDAVPLYIYLNFDFDKDGTCALYLDEDKTIDSMTKYIDALMDSLVEYMYDMMEDEGMSREEVDQLFGMSLSEYFDQQMAEQLTPEILAESFEDVENAEGFYKLDNGKLYVADTEEELKETEDYVTYSFDGNTLKLDAGSDEDVFEDFEELGIELPLVFEKN